MPKLAGIFPIGDTGETFITAEWVPDPDEIAAQLFQLANSLENMYEPMVETQALFKYVTAQNFRKEQDPDGTPWTPLAQTTLDDKKRYGYPETILVRTSALKDAATSDAAWHINERAIVFDASYGAIGEYGRFHQEGSAGWHVTQKFNSGATLTEDERRIDAGGAGSGGSLPQRRFIGVGEDDILAIEDIFIDWINREVGTDMGGPTGLGFGSNIGGTFPIISFTGRGQPILRTPKGPRFGRRS